VPAGLGDVVRWISVSSHLENMARGVIDTRDVLYYLTVAAGSLYVAVYSLGRRHA
jgi:ABC-2 type transport system permease protein